MAIERCGNTPSAVRGRVTVPVVFRSIDVARDTILVAIKELRIFRPRVGVREAGGLDDELILETGSIGPAR